MVQKHKKARENGKRLRNSNALKAKTGRNPEAPKTAIPGNLFASLAGGLSKAIARPKRLGRATGKSANRLVPHATPNPPPAPAATTETPATDKASESIYWDKDLPGFGIRVYASGRRVYFVQYRERGRTRRRTIAAVDEIAARTARRRARKILSEVSIGLGVEDPFKVAVDTSAMRFADLVPLYLTAEERRWKESTRKTTRKMIDKIFVPEFGATPVCDITREMVLNWFDSMGDRPGFANRGMPVLSGMMKFAETLKLRPRLSNPCRGITRYKANNRIRFLSIGELARLGEALDHYETEHPEACTVIRLLLLTGARSDEIEGLEPDEIDDGFFHLKDSKNGPRPVYVGAAAQAVINRLSIDTSAPWVFRKLDSAGHFEMPQLVWTEIRKRARLDDFRLHDLRHTFASYAVMNGVSMPTVSRLLGHGVLESTNRYVHLSNDSVRAAAGRVVGHLARATGFDAKGVGK